jgi:hypothetical protein
MKATPHNDSTVHSSKGHHHQQVTQTSGPGFTKVEVKEVYDGDSDNTVSTQNSTTGSDSPVLFVNTRKNLKRQSVGHPMKIFSGNLY